MDDAKKTKKQLIEELAEARRRIAESEASEGEHKRAEEMLKRRAEQLTALNRASQAVATSLELDQVLAEIVSLTSEVVASDYATVVLVDEEGRLGQSAENLPGVPAIEYWARDEGITSWIVRSHQAVVVDEIGQDGVISLDLGAGTTRSVNPFIVEAGVRSLAGLPLVVKDCLLGVLYLHSLQPAVFRGQLPLLTTFANQVAIAIENARLYEKVQQELTERKQAEEVLQKAYEEMEERVEERTAELQRETAERERLQQEVIEAQKRAIQELSTPIIPVMDRIIIMPLIGSIDSLRAKDIMRALLAGIREHRAKVVILDITGVPIVDSGVANHLNKTIQAARLKGAQTIVTGIADAVAEAIVDLGIDWSGIETLADLQTGLRVALVTMGLRTEGQANHRLEDVRKWETNGKQMVVRLPITK
jgi:anti-anti-sigma regulatory factor